MLRRNRYVKCVVFLLGAVTGRKQADHLQPFSGSTLMDYHARWGHLGFEECLKALGMERGDVDKMVCPECQLAKLKVKPIPTRASTRSDQPIYRIHFDLSGRKLATLDGSRYYLLCTDDHSRYRWVRFMKTKDECAKHLIELIKLVEREKAPLMVSKVRHDGGGEFCNKTFDEFCKSVGIGREKSAPYSQFQDGVSERSINIIDDAARTMMLYAGSATFDWCHAVSHAVYCRNRVPSKALDGLTPIEAYTGTVVTPRKHPPIFGCLGYAKVYVRDKLSNKACKVVFLTSSGEYRGDLVRDISSFSSSLKEFHTRDIKYDIRVFPYKSRMVPRPVPPPMDAEDVKEAEKIEKAQRAADEAAEVKVLSPQLGTDGSQLWEVERIVGKRVSRYGRRDLAPAVRGFDYKVVWKPEGHWPDSWEPEANLSSAVDAINQYNDENEENEEDDEESAAVPLRRSARLNVMSVYEADPATRDQAMRSGQRDEWIAAELEELQSLASHQVWELVDYRVGMNVLGCRFVYKSKRHPDGTVYRWKVRLVAQGFKQREGVDFSDVFASTVAMQSIRLVLWIANFYKFCIRKVDIKTFYLYAPLEEEVYMRQPPGYQVGDKVCRLRKCLYGLRQSARNAYLFLGKALVKVGFHPLKTDSNVYLYHKSDDVCILCIWSDDILVTSSTEMLANEFCEKLRKTFIVEVECEPQDYLQMQLYRDKERRVMKMSQAGYASQLVKKHRLQDCNPTKIPFCSVTLPDPKLVDLDEKLPFMELVGSLLWLLKTRPDIGFYLSVLCRYMSRYDSEVFAHAIKVLKYIKGTIDFGIVYDESSSPEYRYGEGVSMSFQVDSDWGGRVGDSKSTTGWLCKINNSVVYSCSKIQRRPAKSTTEAESNGLEECCGEVEWYRDFLTELHINIEGPTPVWQDNNGALSLTKDPTMRQRTKYFRISQDYIRWCGTVGKVVFMKMLGKDMCVDMLNKCLSYPTFSLHRRFLMGDQSLLKNRQYGKEYSSDDMGDGPRRTKIVTNIHRPRVNGAMIARIQAMFLSFSDHVPSLLRRCCQCDTYLRWCRRTWSWNECTGMVCNEEVVGSYVTCAVCYADAVLDPQLDDWTCPHCVPTVTPTTSRKRRRPNWYRPS